MLEEDEDDYEENLGEAERENINTYEEVDEDVSE
jgi:hypothetical protein